jgi:hypothetical protein
LEKEVLVGWFQRAVNIFGCGAKRFSFACPLSQPRKNVCILGTLQEEMGITWRSNVWTDVLLIAPAEEGQKARWTDNILALNGGRLYGLRKTALDRDAWKEFTSQITTGRLTP